MRWQDRYVQRFYRGHPGWVDGTVEFHQLCTRFIPPNARILEVGPGMGGQTSRFLARIAGSVVGLDVDTVADSNPHLSKVHVYDGSHFPFADASFDAVVSDYVLEHVEEPVKLLCEIRRVLARDGVFLFRTPNAFHYVSIAARILPDLFSVWARGRDSTHRVFQKYFRFNSEKTCRRLLTAAGFRVESLRLIEKEPSYGMSSRALFLLMMVYERVVNSTERLAGLRANLLVAARKPESKR